MANMATSIAVFGATGNLGSSVVSALVATGMHQVTAITRSESKTKIAKGVNILRGDLNSSEFLEKCVEGRDAVIIALGLSAPQDLDRAIVAAAAKKGVKYIFPDEFASQDSLRKHFPFRFHERKQEIRDLISDLGVSSWVAIVNGTWFDFSLANGSYNIDVEKRRATIWTPSTAVATVTTVAKVGKAIAALLSLSHHQIQRHLNRCVYISSFRLSQLDILQGVQSATQTQPNEWEVFYEDTSKAVQDGHDRASQGHVDGLIKVIYAMQFLPDSGGDYEAEHGTANNELGLEQEDLNDVIRSTVARI